MAAKGPEDSYLSGISPQEVDMVVGLTTDSISAQIEQYLDYYGPEESTSFYYVSNQSGGYTSITRSDLLGKPNVVDPLSIPAGEDPTKSDQLKALLQADFAFAFNVTPGMPDERAAWPSSILQLSNNAPPVLVLSLICTTFQVVSLTSTQWINLSQPASSSWLFQVQVGQSLSQVDPNQYKALPTHVQDTIQDLPENPFSIQQLVLDLENPITLVDVPLSDSQIPVDRIHQIGQDLAPFWFSQIAPASENPPLGFAVVANDQTSGLVPTAVTLSLSPYMPWSQSGQHLSTLNYLCSTWNAPPPSPPPSFDWNWVLDPGPGNVAPQGVSAVSRNVLRRYIAEQVQPYASKYCYVPSLSSANGKEPNLWFNTRYTVGSVAPNFTYPDPTDPLILFDYTSQPAEATMTKNDSTLTLDASTWVTYSAAISAQGTATTGPAQINVVQTFCQYIRWKMTDSGNPNNVDTETWLWKKVTQQETFAINVASEGGGILTFTLNAPGYTEASSPQGNPDPDNWRVYSKAPYSMGYQFGIPSLEYFGLFPFAMTGPPFWPFWVPPSFKAINATILPGYQNFSYKDVFFSNNLDLYCTITYNEPTGDEVAGASKTGKAQARRKRHPIPLERANKTPLHGK